MFPVFCYEFVCYFKIKNFSILPSASMVSPFRFPSHIPRNEQQLVSSLIAIWFHQDRRLHENVFSLPNQTAFINFLLFSVFQVVSFTMCHAKFVAITAPVSTTGSTPVMAVLVFSSDRFAAIASTCAKPNQMDAVWWTKPTEINAVPVVWGNVLMSAWTAMRCSTSAAPATPLYANRCNYSSAKRAQSDTTKCWFHHHSQWIQTPHSSRFWIWVCHGCPIPSWRHHPTSPGLPHSARSRHRHQPIHWSPSMPSGNPPLNCSSWT